MTKMNGPSDEIGPMVEGRDFITGLDPGASPEFVRALFKDAIAIEDTPIADQRHIPAPPALDAAGDLPSSSATCSGAHVFVVSQHECVRCGHDPDGLDEQEILALRELLPRGKRRHVDEMFAADERWAEAERAAAERMTRFRRIAAAASPGVLALLREIWEDGFEWGQADWGKNPFEES